jgi:LacI family transcriptional regulator
VPDITNPFFPAIVRGAEDVAWSEGYAVSLTNTVEDLSRERAAFEHFEAHRVDGMIVCSARLPDNELARLVQRHPACVLLNRSAPLEGVASSLEVDDVRGAHLAVAHLANAGRRRIGLLAGPPRSTSFAQRRRWGTPSPSAFHG